MPAPSEPAALSALLLRLPSRTPPAPTETAGSLFVAKGEASAEGFRPAHRRLPQAFHPLPETAHRRCEMTARTRLWLRLEVERHARLKAAAASLGVTAQAILAEVAARALRGPAPATASTQLASGPATASERPRRVKLSIGVTLEQRQRMKAAAKALGQTCQALLSAALDIELAKIEAVKAFAEGASAGTAAASPALPGQGEAAPPSRLQFPRPSSEPPSLLAALDASAA
jgi:predicted DNA-binding protein